MDYVTYNILNCLQHCIGKRLGDDNGSKENDVPEKTERFRILVRVIFPHPL